VRELFDHAFGDSGGEQRITVGNDANCGDQLFGRVVLENEAAGAGTEGLVDVLVEVECRQDEDPGRVIGGEDAPGRFEAVELGHPDVHQHDRGSIADGLIDRLEAVACLGDDLDVRFTGKQHAETRADHRLIVGDEDADTHGRPPSSGRRAFSTKPPSGAVPAVSSPP
jgi:hypothetical protein